jgi:hypothetical protein
MPSFPDWFRTEMMAAMEKDLTEEQMRTLCAKYPLGIGEPQDVAQASLSWFGGERWITGTVLTVDGGYTAQYGCGMKAKIRAITYALPEKVLSNQELASLLSRLDRRRGSSRRSAL